MKEYFILTVISICATLLIATAKVCFASKCSNVEFCFGLLKVEREVDLEKQQYAEEKEEIIIQTQNEQKRHHHPHSSLEPEL